MWGVRGVAVGGAVGFKMKKGVVDLGRIRRRKGTGKSSSMLEKAVLKVGLLRTKRAARVEQAKTATVTGGKVPHPKHGNRKTVHDRNNIPLPPQNLPNHQLLRLHPTPLPTRPQALAGVPRSKPPSSR